MDCWGLTGHIHLPNAWIKSATQMNHPPTHPQKACARTLTHLHRISSFLFPYFLSLVPQKVSSEQQVDLINV